MKNGALNAFYQKPSDDESEMSASICSEYEVHDSARTMIGIEKCESDGESVTQLDFRRSVKREGSLACMSTRKARTQIKG